MARKKKVNLPVFAIIEMPKWKAKILDIVTSMLFPGEKYFVLTIHETNFLTDGKKYTDLETGFEIEL